MNANWDESGSCVQCGYMPFESTEFCTECYDDSNYNKNVKNIYRDTIIQLENDLHEQGVNYLLNNDVNFIINSQKEYDELDKFLRKYKHMDYSICHFTDMKIYYPKQQLECRVQKFLECNI